MIDQHQTQSISKAVSSKLDELIASGRTGEVFVTVRQDASRKEIAFPEIRFPAEE